jgi:hypothetical protein
MYFSTHLNYCTYSRCVIIILTKYTLDKAILLSCLFMTQVFKVNRIKLKHSKNNGLYEYVTINALEVDDNCNL